MSYWKELNPGNTANWAYSELVTEVIRLRTISMRQSEMLAQALHEKNHATSATNAATESFIAKLEKQIEDWKNAYVSLRARFEKSEACHTADAALLEQLKNDFKKVLNR